MKPKLSGGFNFNTPTFYTYSYEYIEQGVAKVYKPVFQCENDNLHCIIRDAFELAKADNWLTLHTFYSIMYEQFNRFTHHQSDSNERLETPRNHAFIMRMRCYLSTMTSTNYKLCVLTVLVMLAEVQTPSSHDLDTIADVIVSYSEYSIPQEHDLPRQLRFDYRLTDYPYYQHYQECYDAFKLQLQARSEFLDKLDDSLPDGLLAAYESYCILSACGDFCALTTSFMTFLKPTDSVSSMSKHWFMNYTPSHGPIVDMDYSQSQGHLLHRIQQRSLPMDVLINGNLLYQLPGLMVKDKALVSNKIDFLYDFTFAACDSGHQLSFLLNACKMKAATQPAHEGNAYPEHDHSFILGDPLTVDNADILKSKALNHSSRLNTIITNLVDLTVQREFTRAEQSTFDTTVFSQDLSDAFESGVTEETILEINEYLGETDIKTLAIEYENLSYHHKAYLNSLARGQWYQHDLTMAKSRISLNSKASSSDNSSMDIEGMNLTPSDRFNSNDYPSNVILTADQQKKLRLHCNRCFLVYYLLSAEKNHNAWENCPFFRIPGLCYDNDFARAKYALGSAQHLEHLSNCVCTFCLKIQAMLDIIHFKGDKHNLGYPSYLELARAGAESTVISGQSYVEMFSKYSFDRTPELTISPDLKYHPSRYIDKIKIEDRVAVFSDLANGIQVYPHPLSRALDEVFPGKFIIFITGKGLGSSVMKAFNHSLFVQFYQLCSLDHQNWGPMPVDINKPLDIQSPHYNALTTGVYPTKATTDLPVLRSGGVGRFTVDLTQFKTDVKQQRIVSLAQKYWYGKLMSDYERSSKAFTKYLEPQFIRQVAAKTKEEKMLADAEERTIQLLRQKPQMNPGKYISLMMFELASVCQPLFAPDLPLEENFSHFLHSMCTMSQTSQPHQLCALCSYYPRCHYPIGLIHYPTDCLWNRLHIERAILIWEYLSGLQSLDLNSHSLIEFVEDRVIIDLILARFVEKHYNDRDELAFYMLNNRGKDFHYTNNYCKLQPNVIGTLSGSPVKFSAYDEYLPPQLPDEPNHEYLERLTTSPIRYPVDLTFHDSLEDTEKELNSALYKLNGLSRLETQMTTRKKFAKENKRKRQSQGQSSAKGSLYKN